MSTAAPPIQNLDSIDIVGERIDGGVDLVVVCSGPLDDSEETLRLLDLKISGYIAAAVHDNFSRLYPAAARGATRIFVSCSHPVSAAAKQLIEYLASSTERRNVVISLVRDMA